jgi:hypothetical protein
MFCRQYPTGACATGNGGVRSRRHNVASSCGDGSVIVRRRYDCEPQGGRELGWGGRVNRGESLLNAVSNDQRKRLRRWDQKVRGQVQVLLTHLTQTVPHRRRGETYPTPVRTGNVVSRYLSRDDLPGKRLVRGAEGDAGRGAWSKRRPLGNRADRGCALGQDHPPGNRADFHVVLRHESVAGERNRDSLIGSSPELLARPCITRQWDDSHRQPVSCRLGDRLR